MDNINWNKLELIIFDVDGTLYNQSKLRKKMCLMLIAYYTIRPWKIKDLKILYHFRKERERKSGYQSINLTREQYEWCAQKVNTSLEDVKRVVDKWIFEFPNKYLKQFMYPGVQTFFLDLDKKNIRKAVFSDYESEKKLASMELTVDISVSSTDDNINAMKPLPKGIFHILTELNITNKSNCLFIGDRLELDGKSAKSAGIPFLIIDKKKAKINLYKSLSNKLLNES